MFLHQLLAELDPLIDLNSVADVAIRGVCDDSRILRPGEIFIARSGTKTQGSRFISQAIERGAAAVVSAETPDHCSLPVIVLADPASAAGRLSHILHGWPARRLRVAGITGTNGKTTTAYLLRHLLAKAGQKCGMIGTVEIDDGRSHRQATMTTPGAVELAALFAAMVDNGCSACAMETSSHALHQGRVRGIDFAGAAFTNLTGDHFDYHGNFQNYAAAKAILFEGLSTHAVAAVNGDDPAWRTMTGRCQARLIRFGFATDADYRAADCASSSQGSHFILHTPDGSAEVQMAMIGRHNIANALTAAALAGEVFGMSVHQIAQGLKDAQAAPGRLQAVRCGQPFAVLVDYAHTDDALQNVLTALRPLTRGKLRVLFGCGGDRDRTKRPRMARTAERLADAVYVTSDNPRTEDPRAIIDEITVGFVPGEKTPIVIEPDRKEAIARILADAESGDVVLLAGKGHENYQDIANVKHHFDDVEEAAAILQQAWTTKT